MSPTTRSKFQLLLLALAPLCLTVHVATASAAAPPNILLIIGDDHGWNGTSVLMDPDVPGSRSDFYQTPNLESLANSGMRFTNGYSAASICSPTRAALLTGKSPAQLQHTELKDGQPGTARYAGGYVGLPLTPPTPELFDPTDLTLPRIIKQANASYQTALIGKWHLDIPSTTTPVASGFDVGLDSFVPPETVDPWGVQALSNLTNNLMTQYASSNTPFFIQLAHRSPHPPVYALPATQEKYENLPPGVVHHDPAYAAMVENLDTSIGTVLAKVQELGIGDNTYVIYVSDNGAPSNLSSAAPLRIGKASIHEGGIRVPYIIKGPGIDAATVSDVPVLTTDLFATIARMAGFAGPLPSDVEAADLNPILQNGGELPVGMDHLTRAFHSGGEVYHHQPHYMAVTPTSRIRPASTVRDGDYKLYLEYSETAAADKVFLYNLATDISEQVNVAADFPIKTAEMKAKLENYLAAVDASFAYDVKKPIQIAWNAGSPGADPAGWRSTIDLQYKGRETWALGAGSEAPERVAASAFQPGLPGSAFSFDGNDVMRRRFFQVGDPGPRQNTPNVGTPDFDRSVSTDVWFRLDDLQQNHVLFESGDGGLGLSLTVGDADSVGGRNDLRFRVLGASGESLTVTAPIDRFADPTKDFIQAAAVFKDSDTDRYVELYVNGFLAGRVNGQLGSTHSLQWDGFDQGGLGNTGGNGLGANGGSGLLPFAGGLRGEIAAADFYNYALTQTQALANYNAKLAPVSFGVSAYGGGAGPPASRPSSLVEGAAEANVVRVMHERNDQLDATLALNARITEGVTIRGIAAGGALPVGASISSYLLNLDPISGALSATGTVTFDQLILGLIFDPALLASTDKALGSIGDYGATAPRGLDFFGTDFVRVSTDLRTLTFKITAEAEAIQQFRVITAFPPAGDFNSDGEVTGDDLAAWKSAFGATAASDADGDGDSDGADFLSWQRNQGLGAPYAQAAVTSIPEPPAGLLFALALSLAAFARRTVRAVRR